MPRPTICRYFLKRNSAFVALASSAIFLSGCAPTAPGEAAGSRASNAAAPLPAAALTTFTNSPSGLEGKLKENYVGFSFDYPASWQPVKNARDENARNFIKIERLLRGEAKRDFTLENLAVGFFKHSNNARRNAELLPKTVAMLSDQFAAKYPRYKKVSEGRTKIGAYSGYEFRFQSAMRTRGKGIVPLWGRAVLLLQPGTKKGVALWMFASGLAPEIKSPADLGVKGELPAILKSFRFQKASAKTT